MILVHNFITMGRGDGAEFISWHPGSRERGMLALGWVPPCPLLSHCAPPTHGLVPPTFWVSLPLGRLTIPYMTENPANLMIQTDYHKDQVTKSNCISSYNEQSEDELKSAVPGNPSKAVERGLPAEVSLDTPVAAQRDPP